MWIIPHYLSKWGEYMNITETLATNIRVLMAKDKIRTSKMSDDIGVARSTLTQYREGQSKQVRLENLELIAKYLNVSVSDLFKEIGDVNVKSDKIQTK